MTIPDDLLWPAWGVTVAVFLLAVVKFWEDAWWRRRERQDRLWREHRAAYASQLATAREYELKDREVCIKEHELIVKFHQAGLEPPAPGAPLKYLT